MVKDLREGGVEPGTPGSRNLEIQIRPWQTKDAGDLAGALNNKNVQNNLRDGIPYPYTKRDASEYIRAMQNVSPESQYPFAITLNNKAIGSIGVIRRENVHHLTAELGYYLAEEHWHHGIMTEAVRQICNFIFANTDIVRVYAEPFAYNHASCRVLEKAGFQFEGRQRQNAVKNNLTLDMMLYSRLRSYPIHLLQAEEIASAMALSWRVFLEFEAPGYSPEGIAEFKSYIDPATILAKRENKELDLWGAFDNGAHGSTIVGLLAVRQPLHIALLFVDKKHHGRGIARALLETVLADDLVVGGQHTLTVNSSPYAVPIYQRLGFAPTDREKTVNGLCFVPMKRQVVSC